jgi:hypothetical protein
VRINEELPGTAQEELQKEVDAKVTALAEGSENKRGLYVVDEILGVLLDGAYLVVEGRIRKIIEAVPQGEYGAVELWHIYTETEDD